jgi:hypothetical protein
VYQGPRGSCLMKKRGRKISCQGPLKNFLALNWCRNNDEAPKCCPCAPAYGGGWWFYSCFESNLNGEYFTDPKVCFACTAFFVLKCLKFFEKLSSVPGSLDKKGGRQCHLLLNKDGTSIESCFHLSLSHEPDIEYCHFNLMKF